MGEWSVVQEEITTQGLILSFSDVFNAPQMPGLYAWYSILGLGNADLIIESQTRSALRRQTSRYKPNALESEVKGNLGARWKGQLADVSMDDLSKLLEGSEPELNQGVSQAKQQRGTRLMQALEDHASRQALVNTLEKSIPMFLSPLYVGISENLNSRLQSHVNAYRSFSKNRSVVTLEENELDDTDEAAGRSFATRAVNAGFKEDNLQVFLLPFENQFDLNPAQIRNVISGVEYLLNRWTKPTLGVR